MSFYDLAIARIKNRVAEGGHDVRPSLIAEEKGGKLTIVDAVLFSKIGKMAED